MTFHTFRLARADTAVHSAACMIRNGRKIVVQSDVLCSRVWWQPNARCKLPFIVSVADLAACAAAAAGSRRRPAGLCASRLCVCVFAAHNSRDTVVRRGVCVFAAHNSRDTVVRRGVCLQLTTVATR